MDEIKWGHFSDLHFQYKNFSTNLLRSSLLETLKTKQIEFEYIFITGDIYNQGEYDEETTKFINDIAEITKCTNRNNIIICAGNHDVERDYIRKTSIDALIDVTQNKNNELKIDNKFYDIFCIQYFSDFHDKCKKITEVDRKDTLHYVIKYDGMNIIVLNTSIFAGQTHPGQIFKNEEEEKREKDKNNSNLYLIFR